MRQGDSWQEILWENEEGVETPDSPGTVMLALEEYPVMNTSQTPCANRRNGARKMKLNEQRCI